MSTNESLNRVADSVDSQANSVDRLALQLEQDSKTRIKSVKIVFVFLILMLVLSFGNAYGIYQNYRTGEERSRQIEQLREFQDQINKSAVAASRCDVASDTVVQYDACVKKAFEDNGN